MSQESGDLLVRALALGGRARLVAARTSTTVERLREIHTPTPEVAAALGRLATGALLLAASLEKVTAREPVLSLELEGDGPAGRFLATASPRGWTRAMVRNPFATAPDRPDGKLNVAGVVGSKGTLAVARDLGYGQPYRGVVPLVSGEIGDDLATYVRDSEQVRAAVGLGVFVGGDGHVLHAGGYLVDLLPEVGEREAGDLEARLVDLGSVTNRLRAGEGPEEWLARIFPDGVEVTHRHEAFFHCGCSLDRVERALKLLGRGELASLLADAGEKPTEVVCEFCHTAYAVERAELARLLLEVEQEQPPRPGAEA